MDNGLLGVLELDLQDRKNPQGAVFTLQSRQRHQQAERGYQRGVARPIFHWFQGRGRSRRDRSTGQPVGRVLQDDME